MPQDHIRRKRKKILHDDSSSHIFSIPDLLSYRKTVTQTSEQNLSIIQPKFKEQIMKSEEISEQSPPNTLLQKQAHQNVYSFSIL